MTTSLLDMIRRVLRVIDRDRSVWALAIGFAILSAILLNSERIEASFLRLLGEWIGASLAAAAFDALGFHWVLFGEIQNLTYTSEQDRRITYRILFLFVQLLLSLPLASMHEWWALAAFWGWWFMGGLDWLFYFLLKERFVQYADMPWLFTLWGLIGVRKDGINLAWIAPASAAAIFAALCFVK